MATLAKKHRVLTFTLTNSLATTPPIDVSEFETGAILVPDGSAVTQIDWYASTGADDEKGEVATAADTVDASLAAQFVTLPVETYSAGIIYAVITGAASQQVQVILKS